MLWVCKCVLLGRVGRNGKERWGIRRERWKGLVWRDLFGGHGEVRERDGCMLVEVL